MSSCINTHNAGALLLASLWLSACTTPPEQDPTYQKLTEVDGRVLRIERVINNQSLLELSQKDDALQNELRSLRGQLEELQNKVEQLRTQQRDLYADLDKRMQALESTNASAPIAAGNYATPQVADTDAYQTAFNLLREFKYSDAAFAFTQFIGNYPQSKLLDNAQYWLGESHYGLKEFAQAQRDFQAVLEAYPNSAKVPDALLKLGYTQYELKSYKDARATLQRLTAQYADSNSAKLAQQRLAKMTAEGR
ncbi:MAG: tol-pal system protein YbgF [Steroidobacteraceae bacterium]